MNTRKKALMGFILLTLCLWLAPLRHAYSQTEESPEANTPQLERDPQSKPLRVQFSRPEFFQIEKSSKVIVRLSGQTEPGSRIEINPTAVSLGEVKFYSGSDVSISPSAKADNNGRFSLELEVPRGIVQIPLTFTSVNSEKAYAFNFKVKEVTKPLPQGAPEGTQTSFSLVTGLTQYEQDSSPLKYKGTGSNLGFKAHRQIPWGSHRMGRVEITHRQIQLEPGSDFEFMSSNLTHSTASFSMGPNLLANQSQFASEWVPQWRYLLSLDLHSLPVLFRGSSSRGYALNSQNHFLFAPRASIETFTRRSLRWALESRFSLAYPIWSEEELSQKDPFYQIEVALTWRQDHDQKWGLHLTHERQGYGLEIPDKFDGGRSTGEGSFSNFDLSLRYQYGF